MKTLNRILLTVALVGFVLTPSVLMVTTGCSQVPSERVVAYQTLRATGTAAKQSMDAATQLLKQGSITVEQWQRVATNYDTVFQPAFALAVAAAQSDLKPTSPEIANLALQFLALVAALYPVPDHTTNPNP